MADAIEDLGLLMGIDFGSPTPVMLTPRAYQLEMFERSLKGNIIVCMATGSGKTQIARMRIDHDLQRDCQKLIWFLAPSQVLAEQQHGFLDTQLPAFSFRLITGADKPEHWSSNEVWRAALENQNGVVSTAQILLDALKQNFVDLNSVSLLVFDEAHHCSGKHAYNRIMRVKDQQLIEGKLKQEPAILGLTATAMVRDEIRLVAELESNLNAICCNPTVSFEDLDHHVFLPELVQLPFRPGFDQRSTILPAIEAIVHSYEFENDPALTRLRRSTFERDQQKLEAFEAKNTSPTLNQLKDLFKKAVYLEETLGSFAANTYVVACINKLMRLPMDVRISSSP